MFRPEESAALRALLSKGAAIIWKPHAETRARERGVSKLDAQRVIERGRVTGMDMQANGEQRWRLAGTDEDNEAFTVVVTPNGDNVLVVTVIK
ncbi:MAG: DUF4258 domain-containing protein [Roseomonas sp.]|jgi:uncharacterized DUF497 family protein|nr:DUF4258 domain-containing protein [Roseomonas sp.]